MYAFAVAGLTLCMISASQCVSALTEAGNGEYPCNKQWDSYDCRIDL